MARYATARHYERGGVWHTTCDCQKCPRDHIFYKAWCSGCAKNHMSYKDYLAQAQSRPPSPYEAPVTARPKYSRGDNPGYRFKTETVMRHAAPLASHFVSVEAIEQTMYGNLYADEVSLCEHCGLVTHTMGIRRRCSGCKHYKRVLKLNHAPDANKNGPVTYARDARFNGPVHVTHPSGPVSDPEEHSVEGALMINRERLCQVCRKIHPKDVPCSEA